MAAADDITGIERRLVDRRLPVGQLVEKEDREVGGVERALTIGNQRGATPSE
jgi:hypothetical protein